MPETLFDATEPDSAGAGSARYDEIRLGRIRTRLWRQFSSTSELCGAEPGQRSARPIEDFPAFPPPLSPLMSKSGWKKRNRSLIV